jgi:serine/threonine protein kinase
VSSSAKDLVKRLLEKNRQKRPSLEETLKHQWFNSFKEIQAERKGTMKDDNGLDSKF